MTYYSIPQTRSAVVQRFIDSQPVLSRCPDCGRYCQDICFVPQGTLCVTCEYRHKLGPTIKIGQYQIKVYVDPTIAPDVFRIERR